MVDDIPQILAEAEELRVKAAGEASNDLEQTRSLYLQAIDKVKTIIEGVTPEELEKTDSKNKIGIGQAFWTIATIYTSLAKHGAKDEKETQEFLDLAKQHLSSPLLETALPEMEKQNVSATNDPLLWKAEINRIKARVEERQPQATAENLSKAILYYTEAIDTAYEAYFSASKEKNRPLQLGALSAYTTALGERAKIRPNKDMPIALTEMATISGILYGIYPELTNFDRIETILGRVIFYCIENHLPGDNPTFRQSILLYLDLANRTKDKSRFKLRLEQLEKLNANLPTELVEALKIISL